MPGEALCDLSGVTLVKTEAWDPSRILGTKVPFELSRQETSIFVGILNFLKNITLFVLYIFSYRGSCMWQILFKPEIRV